MAACTSARRRTCCSIPTATTTTCPTAIPKCCSPASAWKTRTPSSTRCSGGPTAGCTARRAARSPPTSAASAFSRASGATTRPRERFELFSEGGGNTWGLDFDRHGNAIAGTNCGDAVCLHQVQGGYYVKGFAKHGPLHNPYTFGYFEHATTAATSAGTSPAAASSIRAARIPRRSTMLRRRQPAVERHLLARDRADRLDLHDPLRRHPAGNRRHLVPAHRLPHRARRLGVRGRLVRPAGQPRDSRATPGTRPTAGSGRSCTAARPRPASSIWRS